MKNVKFKTMAIALCLATGFAFAGCNAAAEETTKEETTTTTTEATTTTEEETTTTEEETEVSEDETGFEMPDVAAAEDFENETVAAYAQDCLDREIAIYAISADELDSEVDPESYIEGFAGFGGAIEASVDTEEDETAAAGTDYVMVQCAAFATYEDAMTYADTLIQSVTEEGVEVQTEETDEGYTFTATVEFDGMAGSETLDGIVTADGVFFFEATITG